MNENRLRRPSNRGREDADGISVSMTTLVPPRRLGELLRTAREDAGLSIEDLARTSKTHQPDELVAFEAGTHPLGAARLAEILSLYGIHESDVPSRSRLIIDVDEASISMGEELSVPVGGSPDDVLTRYLAIVYKIRGIELGVPIPLRELDIDVLSTALDLEPAGVETSLRQIMSSDEPVRSESRWLRRRMWIPLAGIIVAATTVGVLIVVTDDPEPSVPARVGTPAVVEAPPASVEIGTPAVVETFEPEILDAIVTNDDGEVVVRE